MYIKLERTLIGSGLSHASILCYALIADRIQLSKINGWRDDKGYYVLYSVSRLAADLGLQKRRVYDILSELKQAKLIETIQTKGHPNQIYVLPVPDHFSITDISAEELDIEQLIENAARLESTYIDDDIKKQVYDRIKDRIMNVRNKIGYIRRVLRNWNQEGSGSSGASGRSYDLSLYDATNTIIEWDE